MFSDILLGTTSATTVVPATCCVSTTTCTTTSISGATSPNRSPAEPGTATEDPASQTHPQQTSHAPQVRVTLHANLFKSRVVQAWRARGSPHRGGHFSLWFLQATKFVIMVTDPWHSACQPHAQPLVGHVSIWCSKAIPPKKVFLSLRNHYI